MTKDDTMPAPGRVLCVEGTGSCTGGAEMMLDELVHRVDAGRFTVTVASLKHGPWPERLREEGFSVFVVPQTRWRDVRNVYRVVRQLAELMRREQIELVHASGSGPLLFATLAGKWAKVPVVWMVFDPLSGLSKRRLYTARRRAIARFVGALHPDFVIFGTDRAAEGTPLRGSTPTDEILPGIDLARHTNVNGDEGRARRELGIDADAPLVAMFGRLTYLKSQIELLRAMGRIAEVHPKVRAVICGSESDRAYATRVHALRDELGLEERVLLPGFVTDQMKDDITAAADLVVHLAKRESFGLAVVESQAAGKAVVAFDASGPRSLIEDGVTGALVPVDDIDRLAVVISELLSDATRRTAMGAAAAEAARAHPIEGMVERVEAVWDRVLGGARGGDRTPAR
jgi:glycosyltransferase involved in cell wall biosynthesis